MKQQFIKTVALSLFLLSIPMSQAQARGGVDVHFKNVSNTILTPPVIALCPYRIEPLAEVGKPASIALEKLAEGGDTSMFVERFEDHNCSYQAFSDPVMPGQMVTASLSGYKSYYIYAASMLLPTNDAFVATSGKRVFQVYWRGKLDLVSYDAGTEFNDELCASIPAGGGCGGEGMNDARESNDFVKPHPGLHGNGDLDPAVYNWGEPTAVIYVD